MDHQRKWGIFISYINIILHAIVGILYVPILLYYIGDSEYGLYQLIGAVIGYFAIMDFGLTSTIVRFYSRYKSLNDKINMENILAISLRAYGVITILLLIIGYICYFNIENIFYYSMSDYEIESAQNLFLLLLFNMAFTVSTMIFKAVINAYEKFLFLKGLETVQLVIQPIVIVLVIQECPTAFSVALVQTLLNLIIVIARSYYCFFKLKVKIKYHYWNKELFRNFKKLAISIFMVSLIDQIFFRTNQIILGIISGTVAVAIYSVSAIIYMNYMALSQAISSVYLPHITEMVAKKTSIRELSNLFIKIARWQYFILSLVLSIFIILGKQFIYIWAGKDFENAYWITLLIIIPFTIDLIQNIGLSILQAQNKYDFRAKVYVCMGIVNIFLSILLGLNFGDIGCAFSTGIIMFVGHGLIMNWYYANIIGLTIREFWYQIGKITIGVIGITTAFYFINSFIINENKIVFLVKLILYTAVYIYIMYRFFMNIDEQNKVKKIFLKLRRN